MMAEQDESETATQGKSPEYAEMSVEPWDIEREPAGIKGVPWDLSELGEEISRELKLEGFEELDFEREAPKSSPAPSNHPLLRSSTPSPSPSPGLYGAAASPAPSRLTSRSPVPVLASPPPKEQDQFITFDDDELGELQDALGSALDDALSSFLKDTHPRLETSGHELVALSRFVSSGTSERRHQQSIDKLVDIAAAEQRRSQLFNWSGRRYNHQPGFFEFDNGNKVKEFARDIFGINYDISVIDESALEVGEEGKAMVPIKVSKNPYCDIQLLVGKSSGDYGLKSVNIILKRTAAKKDLKNISEFMVRSGIFLDDMLPFLLDFKNLERRLGDKGLESDMKNIAGVYGALMRRYISQREQKSKPAIMPFGNYSIELNSESDQKPLIVIRIGCTSVDTYSDGAVTLNKEGFRLIVEKYSDRFERPRGFEMYFI